MGSSSSGGSRTVKNWPTFAECLVVPIHRLVRAGLLNGKVAEVRLDWTGGDGESTNSITVINDGPDVSPALKLVYWISEGDKWQRLEQRVDVTQTKLRRGHHWWWLCPLCQRRVRCLAMAPGENSFACRVCFRIASPAHRDRRRTSRSEGDALGIG